MGSHRCRFPINPLIIKWIAIFICVWTMILVAPISQAANADYTLGLGIGGKSSQPPYVDVDRDNTVLPLLHFENRSIRFFVNALDVKLFNIALSEDNKINFALVGRWDGSGYKADDSWMLEGMDERKSGLWAGAKMQWHSHMFNITTDWTHDVSGHSKGQRIRVDLSRAWKLGEHFRLKPYIGLAWYDEKFVDYYYGVTQGEALAERPEYHGDAGINAAAGLMGTYQFNQHHSIMLDIRTQRLSSEIKDSPLVDSSSENRIYFGYMYYF